MTEIVTESPALAGQAVLDREGGLVYTATTTSGNGIFAIGPGQRTPTPVVGDGSSPTVTTDGKTIVFSRVGDKPGLYRVNVDGSGLSRLVERGSSAIILPDDRTVLHVAPNASGLQVLWSVPLAGGPAREILHRFVAASTLGVFPDGRRLRFSAGVVNGRSVDWQCDLPDCTNPRELTLRPGQWTPDGRGVAFVDSADRKNIWVQPIEGGAPRPLTKFTDKEIFDFRWSPDGTRLAITRGTMSADIVLIKGFR